jgi:hypothetical protein
VAKSVARQHFGFASRHPSKIINGIPNLPPALLLISKILTWEHYIDTILASVGQCTLCEYNVTEI